MLKCNTVYHQQVYKVGQKTHVLSHGEDVIYDSGPKEIMKKKFAAKSRDLERSFSYDIVQRKPHPFRSPMVFLRSSSLYRKHSEECLSKLNSLNVQPGWSLDDELNIYTCSTTENTPFANVTVRPYYNQTSLLQHKKLLENTPPIFDCHYGTVKRSPNLRKFSQDNGSLRRRASSLDFLPDSSKTSKSLVQNGNNSNKNVFLRSSSVTQRTGFRRKIGINESDLSQSGLKEIRSKVLKCVKTGIDALFDAIERKDIDDLKKCIDTIDFDINELNIDEFTALDVTLMKGEKEMALLLLRHGAKENPTYSSPEKRIEHLNKLIENAEETVSSLALTVVSAAGEKDNERQLREWEWRLYMLKLMQNGFISSSSPLDPPCFTIAPLTSNSIVVMISAPDKRKEIVTRYKIEWSRKNDFSIIDGEFIMTDMLNLNYTINNLEKNIYWYVRVSAGNMKGHSLWGYPNPNAVVPSSWHDCDDRLPRYFGATDQLCNLLEQLYSYHKEIKIEYTSDNESKSPVHVSNIELKLYNHSKKNTMMKSLHKYTNFIFNSAPKLLKKIKGRGIYLASLLYSDDLTRVLVTIDENLPIVECDDSYSKSFTHEFYWFSKISCTWEDLQHMMLFSEKSCSSHSVEIRRKLIQSALLLMDATGVCNLGPIHYKPFRDNHGSMLLLSVNCVEKNHLNNYRSTTMKWMPIKKLIKKSNNDHMITAEKLIPSIQEQITCHRHSQSILSRGLYLGYLKLQTTVDTLSVIVSNRRTNMLPHVKIQDVPNVTKEEWNWIKNRNSELHPSNLFPIKLNRAIRNLFSQLGIPNEKHLEHRIYDQEVIELKADVMMIVICPPMEELCTPPNQCDIFSKLSTCSSIPVQSFEMLNMMSYQPKLMSAYCRLSSILELENYCMQQNLRECICQDEMKLLKEKQTKLAYFQQSVDSLWRTSRWVVDTLNSCQDKNLNTGIPLSSLMTSIEQSKSKLSVVNDCDESVDELSDSYEMSSSVLSINNSANESDVSLEHRPYLNVDHAIFKNNVNKKYSTTENELYYLTIYANRELGFTELFSIELEVDKGTTFSNVIEKSAARFTRTYPEYFSEIFSETNRLGLTVVSDSYEKLLPDDLSLLKLLEICDKGNLHLRQKPDNVCGFITSV
ncbi:ankyrin-repeat and fibronectin type III domain-containing 1 isoform X8 [Hydra vulgaris]|uniref:Ankyrin-repeat and fibronectin type III domain-containing 1 isoform X8 n=1 Tax=Hydra vulgaris TaxID=6087 RepID=A0ABM4C9M0_HYDVU